MMSIYDDLTILALEKRIPKLAQEATRLAYKQAIDKGSSVVIKEAKGRLVKISADGSQELIKQISSPVKVNMGRKIRLRS